MADTVSPRERSSIMGKVKGRGNKSTELKLIKFFKEYGIKGWRRNYPLTGIPDFVFSKARLAIFVDGCFWHGCPKCYKEPKTNTEFWRKKVEKNLHLRCSVSAIHRVFTVTCEDFHRDMHPDSPSQTFPSCSIRGHPTEVPIIP